MNRQPTLPVIHLDNILQKSEEKMQRDAQRLKDEQARRERERAQAEQEAEAER
jgi:hypothetical protein